MNEDQIRIAIAAALEATGAFDGVHLEGLPEEYGQGASQLAVASIDPAQSNLVTGWDAAPAGGRYYTCTIRVTLIARQREPTLCDAALRQLLGYLRNAVDGQTLVEGYTIPQLTLVKPWTWQARVVPERRIVATVNAPWLDTWDTADTTAPNGVPPA